MMAAKASQLPPPVVMVSMAPVVGPGPYQQAMVSGPMVPGPAQPIDVPGPPQTAMVAPPIQPAVYASNLMVFNIFVRSTSNATRRSTTSTTHAVR